MNRRRLLSMLSLLPMAALAPAVQADTPTAEIDTRPTFKRSDFVLVSAGGARCRDCNVLHGPYYTQGHSEWHPVAFPRDVAENNWSADKLAPVTEGAFPYDFPNLPECCLSGWTGPHEHPTLPFRWVDA